jgi:ribonuclease BN (tRNA processing enzyme)
LTTWEVSRRFSSARRTRRRRATDANRCASSAPADWKSSSGYKLTRQPFPLEFQEVAPLEEFEILPDLRAKTFSTPHTAESLALRVTDENRATIVYTSDTGYTEALASFGRDADLFLMECSFPHSKPVETHLELKDAMRLAELSGARRVLLAHLYPEWDGIDLPAEAKKLWPGETLEATDGLRVDIRHKVEG